MPGQATEGVSLTSGGKVLTLGATLLPASSITLRLPATAGTRRLINGMLDPRAKIEGAAALGKGPLRFGFDPGRQIGFRGILRGLRVSSINRYPGTLPPAALPRLLAADDQTLYAIDFEADSSDEVNLAGTSGGTGKSLGAQWVHLGYNGEYIAELEPGRVDLMRTFIASRQTLEGTTWRTSTILQLKSPRGRTAMLVPTCRRRITASKALSPAPVARAAWPSAWCWIASPP